MNFQKSKYKDIKILTHKRIKTQPKKSINQLKNIIIECIKKQVSEEKIILTDYNTGIFFVSSYIHNRLLRQGFYRTKNSAFFDPIKFTNSILNSFTYLIAYNFGIRGYSNSYILCTWDDIISDFLSINIMNGIVIFIEKNNKEIVIDIYIIKK